MAGRSLRNPGFTFALLGDRCAPGVGRSRAGARMTWPGTVIYSGAQRKRPTVDYTVPAAAKWWASVPAAVARMAGGAGGVMGGTFLDSATPQNR